MRIHDAAASFAVPNAEQGLKTARSEPAAGGKLSAAGGDQVVLSSAGTSALSDSATRISMIKATVTSGDYNPASRLIANKMVAGALAGIG